MVYPLIHLNGTSRQALIEQYETALEAVNTALVAMDHAAPHPRDYYPLGDKAWPLARAEHNQHIAQLGETRNYLRGIINNLTKEA